jgi:hypothetical protein
MDPAAPSPTATRNPIALFTSMVIHSTLWVGFVENDNSKDLNCLLTAKCVMDEQPGFTRQEGEFGNDSGQTPRRRCDRTVAGRAGIDSRPVVEEDSLDHRGDHRRDRLDRGTATGTTLRQDRMTRFRSVSRCGPRGVVRFVEVAAMGAGRLGLASRLSNSRNRSFGQTGKQSLRSAATQPRPGDLDRRDQDRQ